MLAVRRVLDVADHCIIDSVCSGRNVLEESASAAYSVKVLETVAFLLDGFKDSFLSERSLVDDMRVLSYFGRIMVDAYTHYFILIFKNADLGRSSTRVDYKNSFHEIDTPFGITFLYACIIRCVPIIIPHYMRFRTLFVSVVELAALQFCQEFFPEPDI